MLFYCDNGYGEPPHLKLWNKVRPRLLAYNVQLLTDEEVACALDRLKNNPRCGMSKFIAALLAAYWGLRAREIARLTRGDVLLGRHIVIVIRINSDFCCSNVYLVIHYRRGIC